MKQTRTIWVGLETWHTMYFRLYSSLLPPKYTFHSLLLSPRFWFFNGVGNFPGSGHLVGFDHHARFPNPQNVTTLWYGKCCRGLEAIFTSLISLDYNKGSFVQISTHRRRFNEGSTSANLSESSPSYRHGLFDLCLFFRLSWNGLAHAYRTLLFGRFKGVWE